MNTRTLLCLLAVSISGCQDPARDTDPSGRAPQGSAGKADGVGDALPTIEVLLTDPHCDVCTPQDKAALKGGRSAIVRKVVDLIEAATTSIDVAQFTFSVREIEAALLQAHQDGVKVRLAIDAGQKRDGTVARRLADAGLAVRFVSGRAPRGRGYGGLQHAKFMIVDGATLLTGSNNWSSTGTSINEENTIVLRADLADPVLAGFACHFEAIWASDVEAAGACSNTVATFTPGTAPIRMLKQALRGAERSVDVLMHHLLFRDLVKVLAQIAERGVRVRVIVNAADRDEVQGAQWDRLFAAGGRVRFKRTNGDLYQIMHDKLAIVDGRVLLNGSGNWSGSAFFNNYENFVRWEQPQVVDAFRRTFRRLWTWSLSAESLEAGTTPAQQHADSTRIFFGNLHAHYRAADGDRLLDDGELDRLDAEGVAYSVEQEVPEGGAARYAFEYAREKGGMDFLALSPHCQQADPDLAPDVPNMTEAGFADLLEAAGQVNEASRGEFLALPAMEWSTNSAGNHVNVFGTRRIAKVLRGRFDLLYEGFLPERRLAGDRPIVQYNHPRTLRKNEAYLDGSWDRIYGVNLTEIPKAGQRKKKFNDYGLDDYPPLRDVRDRWIAGEAMPDRAIVQATLARIEAVSRPYLRLMEVTLGRGKEIGHEDGQNPSLTLDEAGDLVRRSRVHSDWDLYLLDGYRLAPTAPHDNHHANWGTGHTSRTALIAPRLDEDGLLGAMEARAAYASEDENLALRFYLDDRVPMGAELGTLAASAKVSIWLHDPDFSGFYEVQLMQGKVGGDQVVEIARLDGAVGDQWIELPIELPEGESFVYLQVTEPGPQRRAWSAPIWVRRIDP